MKNSRTLGACLEDYRGGEFESNRILAEFCRVTYRTASEWGKVREPKGEQLNLVWHFLDSHGHVVSAYGRLPEAVRYLGKIIAFGEMTRDEARAMLEINADEWLPQVKKSEGKGVNVNDPSKLVDMKSVGIVDPARVAREAIQNAVSIAGTGMTMGALVVEVPEKASPSQGSGGGMDF